MTRLKIGVGGRGELFGVDYGWHTKRTTAHGTTQLTALQQQLLTPSVPTQYNQPEKVGCLDPGN